MHNILLEFEIQIYHKIQIWRSDIVLIIKKKIDYQLVTFPFQLTIEWQS